MTDTRLERLSRAIATFHEPMPTWAKGRMDGRDHLSDGGWWWCEKGSIGDHMQRNHALEIKRPEIAMRLLKELLAMEPGTVELDNLCGAFTCRIDRVGIIQPSLELAIAEAFAKSVGLEVE